MHKIISKVLLCLFLFGIFYVFSRGINFYFVKHKKNDAVQFPLDKAQNTFMEKSKGQQQDIIQTTGFSVNAEFDNGNSILALYENILNNACFADLDLFGNFIFPGKKKNFFKKSQRNSDTINSSSNLIQSQTISVDNIEVDILRNDKPWTGDILVLPGWNFNRKQWCDSTQLCSNALKKGYRLVLPEMGKSIYASQYFPESRKDWRKYPTLCWVIETLIPLLQKNYGVFTQEKNYLIGLSTGARGVVLIAMNTEALFKAGAALSGDYDQTKMPNDKLMSGIYGPYQKFYDRWSATDNPTIQINKLNIPIYFGHGVNDKVVPYSQTKEFYDLLRQIKPGLKVTLNSPKQGHDFKYWDSEIDNVLNFFSDQGTAVEKNGHKAKKYSMEPSHKKRNVLE